MNNEGQIQNAPPRAGAAAAANNQIVNQLETIFSNPKANIPSSTEKKQGIQLPQNSCTTVSSLHKQPTDGQMQQWRVTSNWP